MSGSSKQNQGSQIVGPRWWPMLCWRQISCLLSLRRSPDSYALYVPLGTVLQTVLSLPIVNSSLDSSPLADHKSSLYFTYQSSHLLQVSFWLNLRICIPWPQPLNSLETASSHFLLTLHKNSEICLPQLSTEDKLAGWDAVRKLLFLPQLDLVCAWPTLNSGICLHL